jgi:hypothetical protein
LPGEPGLSAVSMLGEEQHTIPSSVQSRLPSVTSSLMAGCQLFLLRIMGSLPSSNFLSTDACLTRASSIVVMCVVVVVRRV